MLWRLIYYYTEGRPSLCCCSKITKLCGGIRKGIYPQDEGDSWVASICNCLFHVCAGMSLFFSDSLLTKSHEDLNGSSTAIAKCKLSALNVHDLIILHKKTCKQEIQTLWSSKLITLPGLQSYFGRSAQSKVQQKTFVLISRSFMNLKELQETASLLFGLDSRVTL